MEAVVVGANVTVVVAVVVEAVVVGAKVAVVVGATVVVSKGGKVVVKIGETSVVMLVSGSNTSPPPYVCACAGRDAPSRSEMTGVVVAPFSNSARRRSAWIDNISRGSFMLDPVKIILATPSVGLFDAELDHP